ncbi:P-loop containing nucleoside triphosphate hydrolase protein [Ustulina deusta]|nr:P-loop containing nucleoside triphosphate hydrolase protein [Ustulina deusta]
MATTNSAGMLEVSGHARVQVGNIYNSGESPTDSYQKGPLRRFVKPMTAVPERSETPPKPSFNIPFRRDTDFVKRDTILNQLHQACLEPASRMALVGLGGVGKSQLAIEHAYRVRDMFKQEKKEVWAFWVHASTRARVDEGFKAIADAVKIPGRHQSNADILQLVYQWLQNERNGQWLMVLDSADDIGVFYDTDAKAKQTATPGGEKRALWTYLPQSSNGSILVTTRDKELGAKLTGGRKYIIDVRSMDHDQALKLLAIKSGSQYDKEDGTKLVEALECMPLAISQAAAYIQERAPRISVKKYLDTFQKSDRNMLSLLNHDGGDLRRDGSASNSVITTWQISFDFIRSIRPSATDLLSLMSFFDCEGILEYLVRPIDQNKNQNDEGHSDNESIASSEASNPEFEEDITTLRNYCLVTTNETGDVFEMHGLVQLSTRKWLDVCGETEKFKEQYISRMAQAFPHPYFENWGICRQLFPHVEKAIQYRPINKESQIEWALILDNGGWFSSDQGNYTIAETMATIARGAYETVLGSEHLDTLTSMNNLALTYQNQGRWKEAEFLVAEVLEIKKRVLGLEHPNTLTSMSNLASTYWNQGRWEEAEFLGAEVLEIMKRVLGLEHPNTLTSMNSLAIIYQNQGRWEEAEFLGAEVLEIRKRVLGLEHPNTLTSMSNLASTYWNQGRWKKTEFLGAEVLEIMKRVLGLEHPNTLISMNNLAVTWNSQGRNHDALELMEQCYQACIRVLGPDHHDTQGSLRWIQIWRTEEPQTSERR